MDSMDLEREKGITILAKNTAVRYGDVKLNIVDTPGHADFGGEVERGLTMVDGVLLLVDASEGPLPQTRFVLRKALEARLPVILVVNKVDRPDARIDEVVDEVYELFLDLDADESQIDFPIVYTNAKAGTARRSTRTSRAPTCSRCSTCCSSTSPLPSTKPDHPLQAHVTNLDASPVRRAAGHLPGAPRDDPARRDRRLVPATTARSSGCGSPSCTSPRRWTASTPIEAAAGRDHLGGRASRRSRSATRSTDADDPRPLPVITVDEPSLSVTIGINTSPLAGQDGAVPHRQPGQGAARARARRQRVAADRGDRATRRVGGPGPRRAGAGHPRRADAPRGLRADRRQAAGRHARDRRHSCTSRWSG